MNTARDRCLKWCWFMWWVAPLKRGVFSLRRASKQERNLYAKDNP